MRSPGAPILSLPCGRPRISAGRIVIAAMRWASGISPECTADSDRASFRRGPVIQSAIRFGGVGRDLKGRHLQPLDPHGCCRKALGLISVREVFLNKLLERLLDDSAFVWV